MSVRGVIFWGWGWDWGRVTMEASTAELAMIKRMALQQEQWQAWVE